MAVRSHSRGQRSVRRDTTLRPPVWWDGPVTRTDTGLQTLDPPWKVPKGTLKRSQPHGSSPGPVRTRGETGLFVLRHTHGSGDRTSNRARLKEGRGRLSPEQETKGKDARRRRRLVVSLTSIPVQHPGAPLRPLESGLSPREGPHRVTSVPIYFTLLPCKPRLSSD